MPKSNAKTEQMRRLTNRVVLSGALAELDYTFDKTKNTNVPYVRAKGVIQCGDSAVYKVPFNAFVKAQKSNGEDNEYYDTWKKWVKDAVPMTKDKDNPTMVRLVGSMTSNPYVGSDGKFHKNATQNTMSWIYDFDEYAATFDIEGYIYSITDETKKEDDEDVETGRKKIRLMSTDFYQNVLDIPNIIVPEEMVDALEEYGYVKGATVSLYADWTPSENAAPVVKSKGFGKQRVATGRNFLQLVLTGGDEAYDEESDKAIPRETANAMAQEHNARLKEIEANGYRGGSNNKNRNGGIGSAKKKDSNGFTEMDSVDDDDDIPF